MSPVRIRYATYEFGTLDIHLRTLRDRQQYEDVDRAAEQLGISEAVWGHFGTVWQAGEVLAGLMASYDIDGLRILEVGCGIGLASLVLQQRRADITATDHHPQAQAYLLANTRLNQLPAIPFLRAGWGDPETHLGRFDLLIGSDLLYDDHTAALLPGFFERHVCAHGVVILVDPGRGLLARFSRRMAALGFDTSTVTLSASAVDDFSGQVRRYEKTGLPAVAPPAVSLLEPAPGVH